MNRFYLIVNFILNARLLLISFKPSICCSIFKMIIILELEFTNYTIILNFAKKSVLSVVHFQQEPGPNKSTYANKTSTSHFQCFEVLICLLTHYELSSQYRPPLFTFSHVNITPAPIPN